MNVKPLACSRSAGSARPTNPQCAPPSYTKPDTGDQLVLQMRAKIGTGFRVISHSAKSLGIGNHGALRVAHRIVVRHGLRPNCRNPKVLGRLDVHDFGPGAPTSIALSPTRSVAFCMPSTSRSISTQPPRLGLSASVVSGRVISVMLDKAAAAGHVRRISVKPSRLPCESHGHALALDIAAEAGRAMRVAMGRVDPR